MKFLAHLQQMVASEIMNIIPMDVYQEIKQKDSAPLFRAYVVGHEGEAEGKIVGAGKTIKQWFSSAINKLVEKLQYGTKIFHNHGQTNIHEGRTPIGELVGKTIKTIKDKINAIAITYIYPDYRDLPLDVASIEADIDINPLEQDSVHAVDVKGVTGIALGNSAVQKPGFAGATLLSELQAFVSQSQFDKGGGDMPTLSEIKEFVQKEGISPSEIFGMESLTGDPVVEGFVKERTREAVAGEYAHRKRTDEKFDEKDKEWQKEKEKLEGEIKKFKTESVKTKALDLFKSKAKERKLDEKQTKFIESKQKDFVPEDLDNPEKEIDKFMDSSLEEYKETAKIFGHKIEEKEDKKGGGEPGEGGKEEDVSHIPD